MFTANKNLIPFRRSPCPLSPSSRILYTYESSRFTRLVLIYLPRDANLRFSVCFDFQITFFRLIESLIVFFAMFESNTYPANFRLPLKDFLFWKRKHVTEMTQVAPPTYRYSNIFSSTTVSKNQEPTKSSNLGPVTPYRLPKYKITTSLSLLT